MSANSDELLLIDVHTGSTLAEVETSGLDVFFPAGIGWTEVLDGRIAPYTEQAIEDVCHFAEHCRKEYVLVGRSQLNQVEVEPTEA